MVNFKILVIGETCLDVFVYGKQTRKSPEGVGMVFIPQRYVYNDGMASNTANNIKKMGPTVELITSNGNIIKTRYVDDISNELYLRVDENDSVDRFDINSILDLKKFDAVVISDYDKGFLSEDDIQKISLLHQLVILDTKKKLGNWCKHVKFIKLNRIEFENNKNVIDNNNWMSDKLIITLDSDGSKYKDIHLPISPIDNPDVSGAGDTFIAAFTVKYLQTLDVIESIKWGNYCARMVVSVRGISVYN